MKNKINIIILIFLLSNLKNNFATCPRLEKCLQAIELLSLKGDFKCALVQLGTMIKQHNDFKSYTGRIEKVLKSIEASTLSEADKVKARELFSKVVAKSK